MSPFLQAAFALVASGALAYGLYRLLNPSKFDTSRIAKGKRFGATTGSFIALVTLTRALSSWDNIDLWIAVPLLTGICWFLATLLGCALGRKAAAPASDQRAPSIQSMPKSLVSPTDANWEQAAAEFDSSNRRPGLWARSFAEAQGNEAAAKANYLRHRALELTAASSVKTSAFGESSDLIHSQSGNPAEPGDQDLQNAIDLVAKYGEAAVRDLKHAHRTVGDVIPVARLVDHIISQYEGKQSV